MSKPSTLGTPWKCSTLGGSLWPTGKGRSQPGTPAEAFKQAGDLNESPARSAARVPEGGRRAAAAAPASVTRGASHQQAPASLTLGATPLTTERRGPRGTSASCRGTNEDSELARVPRRTQPQGGSVTKEQPED